MPFTVHGVKVGATPFHAALRRHVARLDGIMTGMEASGVEVAHGLVEAEGRYAPSAESPHRERASGTGLATFEVNLVRERIDHLSRSGRQRNPVGTGQFRADEGTGSNGPVPQPSFHAGHRLQYVIETVGHKLQSILARRDEVHLHARRRSEGNRDRYAHIQEVVPDVALTVHGPPQLTEEPAHSRKDT